MATQAEALTLAPCFQLDLVFDRPLEIPSVSGERGFFRIVEGRAAGARLNGVVADDGGDWIVFRPDGVAEFETRMILRTDDGELVYLRSRGVLRATPQHFADFRAGKGLSAGAFYYRTTPYFDTPVGRYDWLTKSIFIGTGSFAGDRSTLSIHEVL